MNHQPKKINTAPYLKLSDELDEMWGLCELCDWDKWK